MPKFFSMDHQMGQIDKKLAYQQNQWSELYPCRETQLDKIIFHPALPLCHIACLVTD